MGNDLRKLLRAVEAQGFTVKRSGGNHWKVYAADGRFVATLGGTPSGPRWWQNTLAPLKRAGFIWPPPKKKR